MTTYKNKNGKASITNEVSGGHLFEITLPAKARDRNSEFRAVLIDCLNMKMKIERLENAIERSSKWMSAAQSCDKTCDECKADFLFTLDSLK